MNWEYKRIKQSGYTQEEIIDLLNELGKQGWELIQYEEQGIYFSRNKDSYFLAILKRPLEDKKVL
jgi:hypothetical protein